MKKLILILSVVFSLSILGACGHSDSDYKAVYEKIQNGDELTASDYDLMLDYIDDVVSSVSKVKNEEELEQLEDKYPYADKFMSKLMYGSPSEEIQSKIEKKAKKVFERFEKVQKEVEKKLSSGDDSGIDEFSYSSDDSYSSESSYSSDESDSDDDSNSGLLSSVSDSEDWDEFIKSYDEFADEYLALLKKVQKGDVSAIADYADYMNKAQNFISKMNSAKGVLTASQLAKFNRIQQKIAKAASSVKIDQSKINAAADKAMESLNSALSSFGDDDDNDDSDDDW